MTKLRSVSISVSSVLSLFIHSLGLHCRILLVSVAFSMLMKMMMGALASSAVLASPAPTDPAPADPAPAPAQPATLPAPVFPLGHMGSTLVFP